MPDGSAPAASGGVTTRPTADSDRAVLADRARRWPATIEQTVPHQLVPAEPAEALAVAVALLFDAAEPDTAEPPRLLLRRVRRPAVALDPEPGTWRCTATGAEGRGVLELVAWMRGCDMLGAACWLYAVRTAAAWRAGFASIGAREEALRAVERRAA